MSPLLRSHGLTRLSSSCRNGCGEPGLDMGMEREIVEWVLAMPLRGSEARRRRSGYRLYRRVP